jgi:radical SAM superfamily enzyme YgiQ (UPF0313 family)
MTEQGKIIPINKQLVSRKQSNLTPVEISQQPRKNRVALIVAPEWSTSAPPYGMARLAAISHASGYTTKTWDLNIISRSRGPMDYWSSYADWKWTDPHYTDVLHPLLEPILLPYLDDVVNWKPDIIGFSVWYTNDACTSWIAEQIKQRLPDAKILFGGPQATQAKLTRPDIPDHIVCGEGEAIFLNILSYYENPVGVLDKVLVQSKDQRIDLDSMPPADYRDTQFDLYDQYAVSSEFSRGCTANCQYCSETTFWKFRSRQSSSVLDEIESVYKNYGVNSVSFIDSLLNGNLKELQLFAEGLIERNLAVHWTGYCRINGRMDIDFWRLIRQAGGRGFAFGVESGSQRVLDLMKKNCKVWEIEQNFRDLASIGAFSNFATWFVGFPGEEITDVAQTLTLLWRLRNSGMSGQSVGSCGLNHDTPIHLEREKFNVSPSDWCFGWHTTDMRNTVFHRFVRFKTANVLLEVFRSRCTEYTYENIKNYPELKNHYKIISDSTYWRDNIPFEPNFDYNIIKQNNNPVANSLVNEIWPLLRVFWLGMGPFTLHLEFNPDRDFVDFGYLRYPTGDSKYWATYDFTIFSDGEWSADFDIRLQVDPVNEQPGNFGLRWKGKGTWDRPVDNNWPS